MIGVWLHECSTCSNNSCPSERTKAGARQERPVGRPREPGQPQLDVVIGIIGIEPDEQGPDGRDGEHGHDGSRDAADGRDHDDGLHGRGTDGRHDAPAHARTQLRRTQAAAVQPLHDAAAAAAADAPHAADAADADAAALHGQRQRILKYGQHVSLFFIQNTAHVSSLLFRLFLFSFSLSSMVTACGGFLVCHLSVNQETGECKKRIL